MSFTLLGILNSQAEAAGGAGAYDLLETQVLSSSASSVTFTGLGSYSDYKHLQIRAVGRLTDNSRIFPLDMYFNSDNSSGNYSSHQLAMQRNNYTVQSLARTSKNTMENIAILPASQLASNHFGSFAMDILDFSSNSKNTTVRILSGTDDSGSPNPLQYISGLWNSTTAVTSITFTAFLNSGNIADKSRFSLYGIKG